MLGCQKTNRKGNTMRNDTINAQPIDIDWVDAFKNERAEIIYPDTSDLDLNELESLADALGFGFRLTEDETNAEMLDRYREELAEHAMDQSYQIEPQMNYAYPITGFDRDLGGCQSLIVSETSCCLVMLDDEPVLALTGGGMDLSWDICQAYTILGLLPPLHFVSNLPKMAGMSYLKNRETLEACQRTAEIAVRWAQNAVANLNQLETP